MMLTLLVAGAATVACSHTPPPTPYPTYTPLPTYTLAPPKEIIVIKEVTPTPEKPIGIRILEWSQPEYVAGDIHKGLFRGWTIKGVVENAYSHSRSNVKVYFSVYDPADYYLGICLDSMSEIPAGAKVRFDAACFCVDGPIGRVEILSIKPGTRTVR